MIDAFSIIIPIFAIIGLGYVMARWGLMSGTHLDGFQAFIFNIAIPALLFRTMRSVHLPSIVPLHLWGSYYGGVITICLVCFVFALLFMRRNTRESIVFAFSSANPSTTLLGIPIVLSAFGHDAALPLFLILSIHGIILFTSQAVALKIACTDPNGAKKRVPAILVDGLKNAFRSPVILSLMAGLLYGQLDGPWPMALDRGLYMLGQGAIPGALFLMGAMLTGYSLRGAFTPALISAIVKTGLLPAFVYCLGAYVFDLPPVALATATLIAALPPSAFTFIIANQHNTAPQTASLTIILSTIISFITLPLLIGFFTHLISHDIHSLMH